MKIITWNCNKKFRTKAALIAPYKPDIVVIQECENLNKYPIEGDTKPTNIYHYANVNIGIGVVSYTGLGFTPSFTDDTYKAMEMGLCGTISGATPLQIVGVWTGPSKDISNHYIYSIIKFLEKYHDWIAATNTIILGDFNSNLSYDKKIKKPHQTMIDLMKALNMVSVYHEYFKEKQGLETCMTHYHHKKESSPFHLDYIYIPEKLYRNVISFEVGSYETWHKHSDHVPLILEMEY